jgi:hypothetical protein
VTRGPGVAVVTLSVLIGAAVGMLAGHLSAAGRTNDAVLATAQTVLVLGVPPAALMPVALPGMRVPSRGAGIAAARGTPLSNGASNTTPSTPALTPSVTRPSGTATKPPTSNQTGKKPPAEQLHQATGGGA